MIEFFRYANVKDKYCVCYFGNSDEYLVQLRLLKGLLEKRFPGVKINFGCKDDKSHLLGGQSLTISRIKADRYEFAHIREIAFNGITHPIEEFAKESDVVPRLEIVKLPRTTNRCVVVTQSNYPTRPMERERFRLLMSKIHNDGYDIELNTNINNASLVAGVESVQLFEAAAQGIRTILVPTGVGENLYKTMFPDAETFGIR